VNQKIRISQKITTPLKEKIIKEGRVVKLNYTLHENSANGKIIETTIESIAKNNNIFSNT
jgi:hypothetical protein